MTNSHDNIAAAIAEMRRKDTYGYRPAHVPKLCAALESVLAMEEEPSGFGHEHRQPFNIGRRHGYNAALAEMRQRIGRALEVKQDG